MDKSAQHRIEELRTRDYKKRRSFAIISIVPITLAFIGSLIAIMSGLNSNYVLYVFLGLLYISLFVGARIAGRKYRKLTQVERLSIKIFDLAEAVERGEPKAIKNKARSLEDHIDTDYQIEDSIEPSKHVVCKFLSYMKNICGKLRSNTDADIVAVSKKTATHKNLESISQLLLQTGYVFDSLKYMISSIDENLNLKTVPLSEKLISRMLFLVSLYGRRWKICTLVLLVAAGAGILFYGFATIGEFVTSVYFIVLAAFLASVVGIPKYWNVGRKKSTNL